MFKHAMVLSLTLFLVAGCNLNPLIDLWGWFEEARPLVNVQVTEYRDADAFARVIDLLEQRGIKATILTKPDFVTENCDTIRDLQARGYEVMAFARPETAEGDSTTLSSLTREEQQAYLTEIKSAVEDCLGATIDGFRCTRFDQNEDTYEIVDQLAFRYNLGFVANTGRCLPGLDDETLPYRVPEYDFWAVPMHSVYLEDEWVAFCDNPLMSRIEPTEWGALLMSELDRMCSDGHPLLMEVHPYNTGADDEKLAAFEDFLDYAVKRNARFITIAELIEWTERQQDQEAAEEQEASEEQEDNGCPCD
jgi:hypothetical protein